MDTLDVNIFRDLTNDSYGAPHQSDLRRPLKEVARAFRVDEDTVRSRLRRLRKSGFLRGWVAIVNPSLLRMNVTRLWFDVPGRSVNHQADLWGYDRWSGKTHMLSLTSRGAAHDHAGEWEDDRTIVMRWSGVYKGKQTEEELTVVNVSDREVREREVDKVEGKKAVEVELNWVRIA
jgi:DNA-binding Lrp family transcriptional regulator